MSKISGNFLVLLGLFFLGFTHFLGGPYLLAKIIFFLMLFGTLVFAIIVTGLSLFVGRIFGRYFHFSSYRKMKNEGKEAIKVDAKIIE